MEKSKSPQKNPLLTEEEKQLIKKMFFGPYEKAWKNKKGIVDNTDVAISKRSGIPLIQVVGYITLLCDNHMRRVIKENLVKYPIKNKNESK